jgi:hypothetical protein
MIIPFTKYRYFSCLRDDEAAWAATERGRSDIDLPASTGVDYDTMRARAWVLMSHAGVYSGAHHDAGGKCTWIQVVHGAKVWGFLVALEAVEPGPNGHYKNTGQTSMTAADRKAFVDSIAGAVKPNHPRLRRSHIFLTPGSIL